MALIWSRGTLIDASSLAIPIDDRLCEHGIGLFESLRTFEGRAPLLDRHLARLRRSALILRIPLADDQLPDASAVASLTRGGDLRLRLNVTGGNAAGKSTVWMTAAPLMPPPRPEGLRLGLARWSLSRADLLSHHKTMNYWSRRLAYEQAVADDVDEAILRTEDGLVWEGTRTNIWIRRGTQWLTPGLHGPVLPGVFRGWMLDRARSLGVEAAEAELRVEDLQDADEVGVSNSVWGLVPVGSVMKKPVPAGSSGFPGVRAWNEAFRREFGIGGGRR